MKWEKFSLYIMTFFLNFTKNINMMNFNFQELQRKRSASKKSSRRRRELLQAKEFEEKQQTEQEKTKVSLSFIFCKIFGYV